MCPWIRSKKGISDWKVLVVLNNQHQHPFTAVKYAAVEFSGVSG